MSLSALRNVDLHWYAVLLESQGPARYVSGTRGLCTVIENARQNPEDVNHADAHYIGQVERCQNAFLVCPFTFLFTASLS